MLSYFVAYKTGSGLKRAKLTSARNYVPHVHLRVISNTALGKPLIFSPRIENLSVSFCVI